MPPAQPPSDNDIMSFQRAAERNQKPRVFSAPTGISRQAPMPASGGRPSREQAEAAVRTLIAWSGDDPNRAELQATPARVTRAYEEFFSGYHIDTQRFRWALEDAGGYNDMILQTDIDFESHCQHHLLPIIGKAHIAYFPDRNIAGLSKFARIVDIYAKRLQSQERLTQEIAMAVDAALEPRGVAVALTARHLCIMSRGAHKPQINTKTYYYTGIFLDQPYLCERFTNFIAQ